MSAQINNIRPEFDREIVDNRRLRDELRNQL